MNTAPTLTALFDDAPAPKTRQRRTPEQKLQAALLQAERARKQMKRQERASETVRIRVAGEYLLRIADTDPTARNLLAELKRQLQVSAHREAFGLKPLK